MSKPKKRRAVTEWSVRERRPDLSPEELRRRREAARLVLDAVFPP